MPEENLNEDENNEEDAEEVNESDDEIDVIGLA